MRGEFRFTTPLAFKNNATDKDMIAMKVSVILLFGLSVCVETFCGYYEGIPPRTQQTWHQSDIVITGPTPEGKEVDICFRTTSTEGFKLFRKIKGTTTINDPQAGTLVRMTYTVPGNAPCLGEMLGSPFVLKDSFKISDLKKTCPEYAYLQVFNLLFRDADGKEIPRTKIIDVSKSEASKWSQYDNKGNLVSQRFNDLLWIAPVTNTMFVVMCEKVKDNNRKYYFRAVLVKKNGVMELANPTQPCVEAPPKDGLVDRNDCQLGVAKPASQTQFYMRVQRARAKGDSAEDMIAGVQKVAALAKTKNPKLTDATIDIMHWALAELYLL